MTDLQKRFAEEYAACSNITDAGRKAGIQGENVRITAWQMLQLPEVQEYVEFLQAEAAARCNVDLDDWLNELKEIGFTKITDIFQKDFDPIPLDEMTRPGAIKSVKRIVRKDESGTTVTTEITPYDKLSALTTLGKHKGWFKEDNTQKKDDIKIIIKGEEAGLGE